MTKKYDIISLNSELYMVETPAIILKCDKFFYRALPEIHIAGYNKEDNDGFSKTLATTDKSLGLPLLPDVQDNTQKWVEILDGCLIEAPVDFLGTSSNSKHADKEEALWTKTWENAIAELRKAASKKYTEEDLQGLIQVLLEAHTIGTTVFMERKAKEYLSSLYPKPVSVEVEIEMIGNPHVWVDTPSVDENNYVKVKQWIYDN